MEIILVEDEQALADAIIMNLELEGYSVKHYANGKDANNSLSVLSKCQLVILDVMLPEINGIDICKNLREISDVPVLFLSAKGTTSDKIEGLKNGGNDYLSKPFDLEELLLRIQNLIRKPNIPEVTTIKIGNKLIDFKTYQVSNSESQIIASLSKKEIELLKLFSQKENEVVSRDTILNVVWGADQFPTSRTIDNFILSFRKLFETNPKEPIYFHSIRGVGYKFTNPK